MGGVAGASDKMGLEGKGRFVMTLSFSDVFLPVPFLASLLSFIDNSQGVASKRLDNTDYKTVENSKVLAFFRV